MVKIAPREVDSERALNVRLDLRFWAVLVIFVFTALGAAAQGCAMCYQSTAASGVAGRAALRHGILILLVPSISVFFGILALIYRRRNGLRQLEGRRPCPVADEQSLL